jgi:LysW-gamma-L-lysine carboxypeptidase
MGALGYQRAFVDEAGNAVGVMGSGPRQVILLGHIDSVPGKIPVRVEAGMLYGRGSVDAKGPLAAFVDAVGRLGAVDGWQFIVIAAVDEERDSTGARYVAKHYRPDFAIIGEPSDWERVTIGYKGSVWATLSVRRQCAHGASGEQNACEAAVAVWQAVQGWAADFNQERSRRFDQVMPVLRGMASGEDGFEEWARLEINARLPLDLPPQDWRQQIVELSANVAGVVVEACGFDIPAYRVGKNTPLVRALLAGIRETGGRPSFVLKTGTADLNVVAPVWECPAVAYGPGDSALDHSPNECLSLDEFSRAVAVLEAALQTLSC